MLISHDLWESCSTTLLIRIKLEIELDKRKFCDIIDKLIRPGYENVYARRVGKAKKSTDVKSKIISRRHYWISNQFDILISLVKKHRL